MSSGFYVHIPFCRQACRYCDFHFSVSLSQKEKMLKALHLEIESRYEMFGNDTFSTIYFGGGTPSVLSLEDIRSLIRNIMSVYKMEKNVEISLEANPDDLSISYLDGLTKIGVQRLSIGIQSFRDEDLVLMRRSHNSVQATEAIKNAKKAGFKDLNIDLIYGIPGMGTENWNVNIEKALDLGIQHLSAYHLTFEPGTVFDHWRKKKKIFPENEEESLRQFRILKEKTFASGFLHYEISNFALPGFFSKHNSSYWKNKNYLGIGPSAHSYNGNERFWNISSNKTYMEKILSGDSDYFEKEELTKDDMYNEYILTSLRTSWGIDLKEILSRFGDNYVKYTQKSAEKYLDRNILTKQNEKITLFENGIFLADQVIRDFIIVK